MRRVCCCATCPVLTVETDATWHTRIYSGVLFCGRSGNKSLLLYSGCHRATSRHKRGEVRHVAKPITPRHEANTTYVIKSSSVNSFGVSSHLHHHNTASRLLLLYYHTTSPPPKKSRPWSQDNLSIVSKGCKQKRGMCTSKKKNKEGRAQNNETKTQCAQSAPYDATTPGSTFSVDPLLLLNLRHHPHFGRSRPTSAPPL